MISAACSACGVAFDVTNKPAGASFQCPKCQAGTIQVPDPSAVLSLDDAAEIGSATELTDEIGAASELAEEIAGAPAPPRLTRTSRAAGASTGAARRPRAEPAPRRKSPVGLILAGVVVVAGVAGFLLTRDKTDSPGGSPQVAATGTADDPIAPAPAATPIAQLQQRLTALADADLDGRIALLAFCDEQHLTREKGEVMRDILLLDPDSELARSWFGQQRYAGANPRFQGRWLTADETLLADAADD